MAAEPDADDQSPSIYAAQRNRMVDVQIARRGIRDRRLLKAMRMVPREAFVAEGLAEFAYEDVPLRIGEGQTISQPYIVAAMIEAAEIGKNNRVLEVGAGSGYAAAVMSRMARQVYGIERHATLAKAAIRRVHALGYRNIAIKAGDGTKGWPEEAPFDAILVAASGPGVPPALRAQLAIGGRLIIPVGRSERRQTLRRILRRSEADYEEESLGAVTFVPLIGEQGWAEDGSRAASAHILSKVRGRTISQLISDAAEPLPGFDDAAFGRPFDRFADARVVLLGEATHGTSEFQRARAAITRRLIEEHGFTIVAVEADWSDAAAVDRYVRHRLPCASAATPFQRFPAWMWRNTDIEAFVEWMRRHNEPLEYAKRAAFYGLDIYNLYGSIAAVLSYLDSVDPAAAAIARERYGCLTPWQKEPSTYGRAVLTESYRNCEEQVVRQCRDLLAKQLEYSQSDGEAFLGAAQNARLIASAEHYYRIMYYGGAKAWNLRDTHMFETLSHMLDAHGPNAKAVVWAHNAHVGDARFTEMGTLRDELSLGQLVRQQFGEQTVLIGFGTHTGTVAATSGWEGDVQVMRVSPSVAGSYERLCHESEVPRFLLDINGKSNEATRLVLLHAKLERFIGVVYRPDTELTSHYVEASLPQQFDAYLWLDETTAVTPLPPGHRREGVADTYPFEL